MFYFRERGERILGTEYIPFAATAEQVRDGNSVWAIADALLKADDTQSDNTRSDDTQSDDARSDGGAQERALDDAVL